MSEMIALLISLIEEQARRIDELQRRLTDLEDHNLWSSGYRGRCYITYCECGRPSHGQR